MEERRPAWMWLLRRALRVSGVGLLSFLRLVWRLARHRRATPADFHASPAPSAADAEFVSGPSSSSSTASCSTASSSSVKNVSSCSSSSSSSSTSTSTAKNVACCSKNLSPSSPKIVTDSSENFYGVSSSSSPKAAPGSGSTPTADSKNKKRDSKNPDQGQSSSALAFNDVHPASPAVVNANLASGHAYAAAAARARALKWGSPTVLFNAKCPFCDDLTGMRVTISVLCQHPRECWSGRFMMQQQLREARAGKKARARAGAPRSRK